MHAEVGHRFPEAEFYVDPVRVEEFVTALGVEPEPGYRAELGAPVPVGFLMYVTTYGAHPVHEAMQADFLRAVFGGTDVEMLAPLRIGDRLQVRPSVSNFFTKEGARGTLTFAEITCEYLGAEGVVVARERSTVIERGMAKG